MLVFTVIAFPFFYLAYLVWTALCGLPLTAENGRIRIPAADVLPLEQTEQLLNFYRARLRRADTAARGREIYRRMAAGDD